MIIEGDVILFRTKPTFNPLTWIAAAIRLFTNYKYNHCGTVVSKKSVLWLYEMTEKGLEKTILDERIKDADISVLRKGINGQFSKNADSVETLNGYDFVSLFLYQPIFQLTNIWIGREKEKAKKKMYCSEYCAFLHGLNEWWTYSPDMLGKNNRFKKIK